MKADKDKCIGCKRCFPYCPMGRIQTFHKHDAIPGRVYIEIDQDQCTDCGMCGDGRADHPGGRAGQIQPGGAARSDRPADQVAVHTRSLRSTSAGRVPASIRSAVCARRRVAGHVYRLGRGSARFLQRSR